MKPEGEVFDQRWRATCSVQRASRSEVNFMIDRHYLGKWPGVCVLIMSMKHGDAPVGVIVFALPPRETSKRYGGETWELARLWVDDWVPGNAETWLISQAVRYIKQHHPAVKTLISYADPSVGHAGTIYKAANWVADGRTDDERKSPRCDYMDAAGKKYSRRSHVPAGTVVRRVPRISKHRFFYRVQA